jgi:hypothetical protein
MDNIAAGKPTSCGLENQMKKKLGQTLALAFTANLALAGVTNAAELDYNYGELRWVDTELDAGPFDVDGDGFEIGGSMELAQSVHIFGNFRTLDFGSGIDASAFEIGGGYAMPLNNGADLVARLSYIDGEIDGPGGDADDSGFGFSAGARRMFTSQIEGRAFVNYQDLDESGSEVGFEIAGDYFLNDQVALGGSLELGDDVTTWTLGARWYFGAAQR